MNMQWHEFIFSEQRKHKLLRHLVFWAAWWLYFFYVASILFHNLNDLATRSIHLTLSPETIFF